METDRLPRFDATPRQRAILDLIAGGHTNAEIAERVGLSLAGVKYQVSELLSLAGVDSRDELGDYWTARQRRGLRTGGLKLTLVGLAAAVAWPPRPWARSPSRVDPSASRTWAGVS